MVSGITLWLLLARRKRVAARWLFVGYFAVSMFLQNLLFAPIEKTETAASAPEAAMTRTKRRRVRSSIPARWPVIAAQAG